MRTRLPLKRGVTLIEAVAAIVIASIAIPPMLWALRGVHAARADLILTTRARWLAGEKLEDIIADRHAAARGFAYITTGNYPSEPGVSGFSNFSRSVSITETGASLVGAGTGYKEVAVTVAWIDGHSQPRSLSLRTILTSYTP